jgi:hypothetical protein
MTRYFTAVIEFFDLMHRPVFTENTTFGRLASINVFRTKPTQLGLILLGPMLLDA